MGKNKSCVRITTSKQDDEVRKLRTLGYMKE